MFETMSFLYGTHQIAILVVDTDWDDYELGSDFLETEEVCVYTHSISRHEN